MEYKKKSYFVLLCTLLLTFLLGLSGNTYATSFTESELKNIIYNSLTNYGQNLTSEVKNMCNTIDLSTVASKTTEYDYVYIICPIGKTLNEYSNYYMDIFFSNYLGSSKPTPTSCFGLERVSINFKNYNPEFSWASFQRETRITQNGWDISYWRFNDQDVYQYGDGTGNMLLASGWHPSNIDEGVYNDNRFIFSYPTPSTYVTIRNDVEPTNYRWTSTGYQVFLGTLIDSRYTAEIKHNWAKWNGSQYVYNHYIIDYDSKKNGDIRNVYKNTIIENNEYKTNFYIDTYNHANDILHIAITPQEGLNFQSYELYYYIYNNYTVVTNGSVIPISTFSGDYQQQYDNQTTTNDLIENIQQNADNVSDTLTDDSQVNGMLGDLTSGDTNTVAGNFGFSPIDNPFVATIRNVAEGVTDVLLGSGNATVTIGWHDYSYTLRSQDFTLPSNAVVTLIHLICNGFFIWGIYKYGFKLYQWINSGRLQNLVNEANDHQYFWF